MSVEGNKAYMKVVENAAEVEADKIVITWSADGPVALCIQEGSFNWVSILHSSMNDDPVELHWLNVDNVYLAEQMIDVLQTFVKNKQAEEKKKNEKM